MSETTENEFQVGLGVGPAEAEPTPDQREQWKFLKDAAALSREGDWDKGMQIPAGGLNKETGMPFAWVALGRMPDQVAEEEYGDSVSVTDEMIAATRQPTQEVPNPDEHVEEMTPVERWGPWSDDTQIEARSLEDQVEELLAQLAESEAILQERGGEISRLRATLRTLKNDWAHDTLKMESQLRTIERQGYTIDGLRETGRYQRQEISRLRQDNRALQTRLTEYRRPQGDQSA